MSGESSQLQTAKHHMNPLLQLSGAPGTSQLPGAGSADPGGGPLPAAGLAKDGPFATALDAARAGMGLREPVQECDAETPSDPLSAAHSASAPALAPPEPGCAAPAAGTPGGKLLPLAVAESGSGLPPGGVPRGAKGYSAPVGAPAGAAISFDKAPTALADVSGSGSTRAGGGVAPATPAAGMVPDLPAVEVESGAGSAEPKTGPTRGAVPSALPETLRTLAVAEGAPDSKTDAQALRAPVAEAAAVAEAVAALLERRGRSEPAGSVSGPAAAFGPVRTARSAAGEVASAAADVVSASDAGAAAGNDGVESVARAVAPRAGAALLQARDLGALAERVEMLMHRRADAASLKMSLGDLGDLEISVRMESRQAHVHFAVHDPQLRENLEAQLPRLRDLLEQGGLDLGDIGMSSGPDSGGEPESRDRGPARVPSLAADGDVGGQTASDEREWRSGDHLIDAFV